MTASSLEGRPLDYQSSKILLNGGLEHVSVGLDNDFKFTESLDEPLYIRAWTLQGGYCLVESSYVTGTSMRGDVRVLLEPSRVRNGQ